LRTTQDRRRVVNVLVHVRHLLDVNGRSSGLASHARGMWRPCSEETDFRGKVSERRVRRWTIGSPNAHHLGRELVRPLVLDAAIAWFGADRHPSSAGEPSSSPKSELRKQEFAEALLVSPADAISKVR